MKPTGQLRRPRCWSLAAPSSRERCVVRAVDREVLFAGPWRRRRELIIRNRIEHSSAEVCRADSVRPAAFELDQARWNIAVAGAPAEVELTDDVREVLERERIQGVRGAELIPHGVHRG